MPEIQMPKLSDTMTEGTLVSWKKKKGDHVSAGEVLAEIETDKATMEWEATDDGVLNEIYVQEGGRVNVGDRIAFIGGEGEEAGKRARRKTKSPRRLKRRKPRLPRQKAGPATKRTKTRARKIRTVARQSFAARAQDCRRERHRPNGLKGTGPGGRIVEKDVEAAVSETEEPPAAAAAKKTKAPPPTIAAGETARISLTGMRNHRRSARLEPRRSRIFISTSRSTPTRSCAFGRLKSAGEDDDADQNHDQRFYSQRRGSWPPCASQK